MSGDGVADPAELLPCGRCGHNHRRANDWYVRCTHPDCAKPFDGCWITVIDA